MKEGDSAMNESNVQLTCDALFPLGKFISWILALVIVSSSCWSVEGRRRRRNSFDSLHWNRIHPYTCERRKRGEEERRERVNVRVSQLCVCLSELLNSFGTMGQVRQEWEERGKWESEKTCWMKLRVCLLEEGTQLNRLIRERKLSPRLPDSLDALLAMIGEF